MEQKDKALKIALTAIGVLALVMFVYYYVSWRTRKTEHDLNLREKAESSAESKSEFVGIYALAEPVEGLGRRLGFFTVNKKEDGSGGYFGSAKLDTIASTEDATIYLQCPEVNIAEKDFFIKCPDPSVGQISFVGEWQKAPAGGIQVSGKVMWSKDATEVTNKSATLTHNSGG